MVVRGYIGQPHILADGAVLLVIYLAGLCQQVEGACVTSKNSGATEDSDAPFSCSPGLSVSQMIFVAVGVMVVALLLFAFLSACSSVIKDRVNRGKPSGSDPPPMAGSNDQMRAVALQYPNSNQASVPSSGRTEDPSPPAYEEVFAPLKLQETPSRTLVEIELTTLPR